MLPLNEWPDEQAVLWKREAREKPKKAGVLLLRTSRHPLLGPWGLCHHCPSGIMDKSSLVLSTLHVPVPLVLPDRSREEPSLAPSTTFSVLELKGQDGRLLSHGKVSAAERQSANPLPSPQPCRCWLLPSLQLWDSFSSFFCGVQQDLSSNDCFLFKLLSCLPP